jgi:phage gpG-like protein
MSELRWFGDERRRDIEAEMTRRLKASARHVKNRARELISIPGTTQAIKGFSYMGWEIGEDGKRKRVTRKVKKRQKLYNMVTSDAGEPPRKQTGHLRTSVATSEDGLSAPGGVFTSSGSAHAIVGTNLEYGKHLELGTRRMAPRPWLRRALSEMSDKIKALLSRPIN